MVATNTLKRTGAREHQRLKYTIPALVGVGVVAIGFTLWILQIQSGATAYLSGLSIWSRGSAETVRNLEEYAETGDESALNRAQRWFMIPESDMLARINMESDNFNHEYTKKLLIQAENSLDDIDAMIWLFRTFKHAPYFRDAVIAWQNTDESLLAIKSLFNQFYQAHATNDSQAIERLLIQLKVFNENLVQQEMLFRNSINKASRFLVTVLSFFSIFVLSLLSGITIYLIKKLTADLVRSESRFRHTFEQAGIGIAQIDASGRFLKTNRALREILLYKSSKELSEKRLFDLVYREDKALVKQRKKELEQNLIKKLDMKIRLNSKGEKIVWVKLTGSRLEYEKYQPTKYVFLFEDITEQQRLSEELNYQANHDNLTGLVNRRAFEKKLQEILDRTTINEYSHSLCFIDLDQFKVINDTLGYMAGDQLLVQISTQLKKQLRKRDLLARLGGDEFALILDCCEPEAALPVTQSIIDALNEFPFVWENRSFNVGCSIGIAPINNFSRDIEEVIQHADSACHIAKEQGRNRVVIAHQGDAEVSARRDQMEWIQRIRTAVESDRLYLEVQKINAAKCSVDEPGIQSIEVLVRMTDEVGETFSPGAFLPPAERFGIVHLIDRWVIENTCKFFSQNRSYLDAIEYCHINLSGRTFDQENFIEFTESVIKDYKIPGDKLCFEITETAAISNLNSVKTFMASLKQQGCKFALDDFGAGLSSFGYLKHLPVEFLKIDGAFVKNLAHDKSDRAMVKAIKDIGKSLDKLVIAEFVEDNATLDWLAKNDIDLVQGYYIHKPERLDKLF